MNRHSAIIQLNPSVITIIDDVAYDKDYNVVTYDADAVDALVAKEQHKQKRAAAYPSIQDQLDLLWHAMDDGTIPGKGSPWYTAILAVKTQYPKN